MISKNIERAFGVLESCSTSRLDIAERMGYQSSLLCRTTTEELAFEVEKLRNFADSVTHIKLFIITTYQGIYEPCSYQKFSTT